MDYENVKKRLLSIREDTKFGKRASLEEIKKAEEKLGIRFPKSYRRFLEDFNGGSIGHYVIYGLGEEHPDYPGLNVVELTLDLRRHPGRYYYIPDNLIPFYNDGAGNYDCFDTDKFENDECPVVFWNHETFDSNLDDLTKNYHKTHNNFAEWLNELIDNRLKYKEEVDGA